ncbi:MAG: amidase family protein [Alkalispirochaeta sp.]
MINDAFQGFPPLARIRAQVLADGTAAGALVATVRERIARFDAGPEGWHSFLRVNDNAAEDAGQFTAPTDRFDAPAFPLAGVPVAVKDNIDTVALGCTAGSVLLENVPVESDAPVITALIRAGAIIIGKTNLSEWANFRSRRSVSGWSSLGGQTVNPLHPGRTPCGSSSGSATAVAGGLVPAAIGTETDGSIICPAATQGLVGFKPTVGRVSQAGIIPISRRQDTAGPIARTVTDAWILQNALEHPETATPDLDPAPLGGARIGVYPMDAAGRDPHPGVGALFDESCDALRRAGAVLVDLTPPEGIDRINSAEQIVLRWEFLTGIEAYLATRRHSPFRTLQDLVAANTARSAETMPFFGHDLWEGIITDLAAGTLDESAYREACETIDERAGRNGIDRWFRDDGVNVVIAPANGPAWTIDTVNGDRYTGSSVPPAAATGYPALTVPMGTVRGLPIGMGFYGPADGDEELFSFGLAWEHLFRERLHRKDSSIR